MYGSSSSLGGSSPKLGEPGSRGSNDSAAQPTAFSPSSPQLSAEPDEGGSARSAGSASGSLQSNLEVWDFGRQPARVSCGAMYLGGLLSMTLAQSHLCSCGVSEVLGLLVAA